MQIIDKLQYWNKSYVAYLSGERNNKFYEIAEKLNPKKVGQHRALITQSVQQKLRPLINYQ